MVMEKEDYLELLDGKATLLFLSRLLIQKHLFR
jgi:hypothetical protein